MVFMLMLIGQGRQREEKKDGLVGKEIALSKRRYTSSTPEAQHAQT
jgi:hypothetical protein